MMAKEESSIIRQEAVIASKIITLRDEKVILDVHLAELYDVENRALKQAVRRNRDRFPDDFINFVRKTSSLQGLDIRTNLLIFDILFDNINRSSSTGSYKVAWGP